MREPILEPGDIVLTAGRGWISRGIRLCTRTLGESRTKVNHAGIVIQGGPMRLAVLVEALHTVKRHPIAEAYPNGDTDIAVFTPQNIACRNLEKIVAQANGYVGRRYGYGEIARHFADWLLLGAHVFRRLGDTEDYPICSYVVACSYAAAGYTFGVPPGAATPDDIWDFVTANPNYYACVRELKRFA